MRFILCISMFIIIFNFVSCGNYLKQLKEEQSIEIGERRMSVFPLGSYNIKIIDENWSYFDLDGNTYLFCSDFRHFAITKINKDLE